MNTLPDHSVYDIIIEMCEGSPDALADILMQLRDEYPELYRAFVRQSPCRARRREAA